MIVTGVKIIKFHSKFPFISTMLFFIPHSFGILIGISNLLVQNSLRPCRIDPLTLFDESCWCHEAYIFMTVQTHNLSLTLAFMFVDDLNFVRISPLLADRVSILRHYVFSNSLRMTIRVFYDKYTIVSSFFLLPFSQYFQFFIRCYTAVPSLMSADHF